jgi:hypothetical protein
MDFNALQHKLFALDPSDPAEDKKALLAQAGQSQEAPVAEPVVESYNVPEGSLQMDRDYSVNDFAALAGVTTPTPRVAQPIMEASPDPIIVQDKDARIAQLEERVARLEELLTEKSVSKSQQRAAGIALAAKKGDIPKSKLQGASKEMAKMSKNDLEDFAKTKHKGLPSKKESTSIKDELEKRLKEYKTRK